ncbi:MAG: AAA family ATPase [Oscillospiraceae bacterium]|nr:AAA family ATPase [Oscillospiraceae bacterium]
MYLKALEIQGFKSFADKTRLTFEKDITAIVGPNGSGKSNISDAILWVMGEQRTKALRGSKMEDVIFGGTQKRGALGYAQVSLIIDNSAHIFDSDSSEIMLTRRYYRSGESEYYINRESVRLKDINSLLMDTGLGRDGYSIIGQGRIAEIVSTRSSDRREVFEEAAGISRYRYRKEEAEHKLAKTEDNLLRINDKIEELEMQVGPLREQSQVAKRYLKLRDELKIQEISLWMSTLDKLRSQSEGVKAEFEQVSAELDRARYELDALYSSSDSITERMHQKDVETEQARERLSAAEAMASECEANVAVLKANVQSNIDSMQRMLSELDEQKSRVAEINASIAAGKERLSGIDSELRELSEKSFANANVIEGCRIKLKNREDAVERVNEEANKLRVELNSMDARIKMLSDMERDFEGFSKAVKTVMREAQRGNLKGIHAPVAKLVKTQSDYALAIETALGAASQNIVTDSQNTGRAAIELLSRMDAGRATFLPVDTIKGTVLTKLPERAPGFVGLAYELVSFENKYEGIFANLLGRTVVAESLSDAVRMSKDSGNSLRIVTLDGQLINAGGSMTGGSRVGNSGVISRANELEKLRKQRERMAEQEKLGAQQLESARSGLAKVKYQLDMALEDQAELKSSTSSLEAEAKAVDASVSQFTTLLNSLSDDSLIREKTVQAHERRIEDFRQQQRDKEEQLSKINEKIKGIRGEIEAIVKSKMELEGRRSKNDKDAQQRNSDILDLERRRSRIEHKKLAAEMEEKQILDKLWDGYELSHSEAMAIRQDIPNLQKASREINELRREISSLGNPNIGAIEEYERVNGRFEFLTEQRDDVNRAKAELVGIINEITSEMKSIFVSRFREIDHCFKETFTELFGGGKAALVLEDEEDVLNCGIEIKVQPPGKALSNIGLLSGGEMAFVAIALYFAILKVRPTPFCVMDEIEAALDEANVSRYAQYMRRISDKTQFLVITHRRGTMEEADMLYGVTMQEKGVSSVIELDLEEAKKTLEE